MKVAIVHYWLTGMRGGEKVIDALCGMFPQANIFTHVYVPEAVSETIRRHDVSTTFINALPRAPRWYKNYLPLMPMALEQLDLRGYDLIISSESGRRRELLLHLARFISAIAILQCAMCGICTMNTEIAQGRSREC